MKGLSRNPAAALGLLLALATLLSKLPVVEGRGRTVTGGGSTGEDEVHSLITRAKASIDGRRFQDALTALKRALEIEPENAEAHVQMGRAQANLGKLDVAEDLYLRALTHDAEYPPALTALGKLYLYQKKADEARRCFERAIARDPRDGDALLGLGRLETKAIPTDPGAVHRAEQYMRRSLEVSPKNEQALFDYGVILSQLGRHEDAARTFSAAVVLNPTVNFTLLGQFYQGYEQWPRAAETYRSALERDPTDVSALLGYAEVQEMLGHRREAMKKYSKVLEVDADHAQAHAKLGLLLTGTGALNYGAQQACGLNRDEAMWHFHQAIQLDPSIRQANDSLEFCLREEIEERNWAERVAALKAQQQQHQAQPKDGMDAARRRRKRPASSSQQEQVEQVIPKPFEQPLQRLVQWAKRLPDRLQRLCTRVERVLMGMMRKAGGSAEGGVWFNGKPIRSVPVAVVRTAEELMKYVSKSQPVVIRNFQDDFASREQWTREALKKKFGHMPVRVSVSQTGRFDGPEDGVLWGLSPRSEVLVRPPSMSMRFSDFVDLLHLATQPDTPIKETFYLEYLSLAQYLGPELLDMIPRPKAVEQSGLDHLITNFWMGKGNTTSPLHYDDYENLLCQIVGTKELMLFPPADIRYLYYTGRAKGVLEYEYPGTFHRGKLIDSKYAVVFGSSVYMDDPDLGKHPLLVNATPYKVVLEEGDVLYLPAWWHHEVQSHPDPTESLNIAVNYWFRNETAFAEEHEGLRAAAAAARRPVGSDEL